VNLNGFTVKFQFYVLENLAQDCIIGMDFLQRFGAKIDLCNHVVTFLDDSVSLNLTTSMTQNSLIALIKSVTLQPFTENLIPVKLTRPWHEGVGLVEPPQKPDDQGFVVARALVRPCNERTMCRLINPTAGTVNLHKDLVLAQLSSVDQEEIMAVDMDQSRGESHGNGRQVVEPTSRKYTVEELGIKIENARLTSGEQQQFVDLVNEFGDVFALSLADLPGTTVCEHEIDTGDALPVRQRAYKASPVAQKEIMRQVDEMLEAGIIRVAVYGRVPWCWSRRKMER
jgi:hypothetical protein